MDTLQNQLDRKLKQVDTLQNQNVRCFAGILTMFVDDVDRKIFCRKLMTCHAYGTPDYSEILFSTVMILIFYQEQLLHLNIKLHRNYNPQRTRCFL